MYENSKIAAHNIWWKSFKEFVFKCVYLVCVCTFTGQAVGGDAWQRLSADVAEGRSGVRAGVPVVHPREMLHVELAGLGEAETWTGEGSEISALRGKLARLWKAETRRDKTKIIPNN